MSCAHGDVPRVMHKMESVRKQRDGIDLQQPARLRDGFRFCLVVFLAARIALSFLGAVGARDASLEGVSVTGGLHNAFDGMDRWDGPRFISIADSGYTDEVSASLFPGYPLTVRLVAFFLGGRTLTAALLVSNVAFLLSLLWLYALTVDEFDERFARRTVLVLTVFPTSFFFLAPYSESLFLLLSLVMFRMARRGRWIASGVAGALAAATRTIGIMLAPALMAEALSRPRASFTDLARRIGGAAVVLIGPALYVAYWATRGAPMQVLATQSLWHRQLRFPLLTLADGLSLGLQGLSSSEGGRYLTIDIVLTMAVLIPLAVKWRSIPVSYLVYATGSFLLPLVYAPPERPLIGVPRYVIVIFPAFWALAMIIRRPALLLTISAIGWCGLAIAFMNLRPIF